MLDEHIHASAYVDTGATIGSGTKVWHFVHICSGATLGENCTVGQGCFIGTHAVIGSRVKIQNNVSVFDSVHLEDDVFCGPSVVFTNVYNPRSKVERKNEYLPTLVRSGASLGANCTIVCGVTIGIGAFVGAGALVNKDVPDYALVVGVPARKIGWITDFGEPIDFSQGNEYRCPKTNEIYELMGGTVSKKKIGSSE